MSFGRLEGASRIRRALTVSAFVAGFVTAGWLILSARPAQADLKLNPLFTPNMVLQRDRLIPVWGSADAGETVTVSLGKTQATATADAAGHWEALLLPQQATTGLTLTVTGKNTVVLPNVAVGDVWVCSGQSNMEFPVARSKGAAADIAAAKFPQIRLFTVARNAMGEPQTEVKGHWDVCTPETVKGFSAVGFFFGRELHQKLGIPIGLIHSSWGGTPAEAWTSRAALEASPDLSPIVTRWDKIVADFPAALEKYQKEALVKWQADADKAKAAGQPEPRKPAEPTSPYSANRAANLFNGMIAPLIPFGIKGVIWYQGESNTGNPEQYRTLFPTMIRDWRSRWGQDVFPFYWVQLANYQGVQKEPVEPGGWPMLREAQTRTLPLPQTGMALAIDLADADNPGDIHPKNKQDVGKRLALVALAKTYGGTNPYSGPVFDTMEVTGGKARLTFKMTDGGLKARGEKLTGFAISGADGVWKWADASIDGSSVVLSSTEVAVPVAVRYDWANNPIGNLYNGAGLPAVPFRTDVDSPR